MPALLENQSRYTASFKTVPMRMLMQTPALQSTPAQSLPFEQRICNDHELALPWLRHFHSDPLRPNINHPFSNNGSWHRTPNLKLPPHSVAPHLPRVSVVIELLLEAGSDAAAMDRDGFTVLDVALQKGCSEFIEPFAADEELFLEVISRLRMNSSAEGTLESIRKCLGTRVALMRPRISL